MKFRLLKDIKVKNNDIIKFPERKEWCNCGKNILVKNGTIFAPFGENKGETIFWFLKWHKKPDKAHSLMISKDYALQHPKLFNQNEE